MSSIQLSHSLMTCLNTEKYILKISAVINTFAFIIIAFHLLSTFNVPSGSLSTLHLSNLLVYTLTMRHTSYFLNCYMKLKCSEEC